MLPAIAMGSICECLIFEIEDFQYLQPWGPCNEPCSGDKTLTCGGYAAFHLYLPEGADAEVLAAFPGVPASKGYPIRSRLDAVMHPYQPNGYGRHNMYDDDDEDHWEADDNDHGRDEGREDGDTLIPTVSPPVMEYWFWIALAVCIVAVLVKHFPRRDEPAPPDVRRRRRGRRGRNRRT